MSDTSGGMSLEGGARAYAYGYKSDGIDPARCILAANVGGLSVTLCLTPGEARCLAQKLSFAACFAEGIGHE